MRHVSTTFSGQSSCTFSDCPKQLSISRSECCCGDSLGLRCQICRPPTEITAKRPSSYEVFSCMLDLSRLRTNRRASHLAKRAEVAQVIAGCGSQDVSSQMPVLSPSSGSQRSVPTFQISSQFCIA